MKNEKTSEKRRNILKAGSIGLAGLLSAGTASARGKGKDGSPGNSEFGHSRGKDDRNGDDDVPPWLDVEDGQVRLTASRDEWHPADLYDIPDIPKSATPLPFNDFKRLIESDTKVAVEPEIGGEQEGDK